jgi:hypothetical protein
VYEDEGYLWEALEKLNITDLHIVLNDEGYAVWRETPGTEQARYRGRCDPYEICEVEGRARRCTF